MTVPAPRRQGRDIIGMEVGKPDFDTPDTIDEATIRAGNTHSGCLEAIAPGPGDIASRRS